MPHDDIDMLVPHRAPMRLVDRLLNWDEDSVDAEPWLAFKHDAHARTTTLALSAIDPDADFSYDYADLAFTRIAACDAR